MRSFCIANKSIGQKFLDLIDELIFVQAFFDDDIVWVLIGVPFHWEELLNILELFNRQN